MLDFKVGEDMKKKAKKIILLFIFYMLFINTDTLNALVDPVSELEFQPPNNVWLSTYHLFEYYPKKFFIGQEVILTSSNSNSYMNLFCLKKNDNTTVGNKFSKSNVIVGEGQSCAIIKAIEDGYLNVPSTEGTYYYTKFGNAVYTKGDGYWYWNPDGNNQNNSTPVQKLMWSYQGYNGSCEKVPYKGFLLTPIIVQYNSLNSSYPQPTGIIGIKVEKKEEPTNTLKITKISSTTGELITSSATKFQLYRGLRCIDGNKIGEEFDVKGYREIPIPSPGNYSIREVQPPTNYEMPDEACYDVSIDLTKEVTIANTPECDVYRKDITDGKISGSESNENKKKLLIQLYEKELSKGHNYTNLLNFTDNFSHTSCSKRTCPGTGTDKDCLKASYINELSSDDLSCYSTLDSINGGSAYCGYGLSLNPTESYNSQVSKINSGVKSGQLYFDVLNGKIMTGTFTKTCYSLQDTSMAPTLVSDYLKNGKLGEYTLSLDEDIKNSEVQMINEGNEAGIYKYSYSTNVTYTIPEVWTATITGIPCTPGTNGCISLGYGALSKFSDKGEKHLPFELTFSTGKNDITFSDICDYRSEQELITPPGDPNDPGDLKLNIEFRTISKTDSFTNHSGSPRATKTNWCFGTGYKKLNIDEEDADTERTIKRYDLARWAILSYNVPMEYSKGINDYNIRFSDVNEDTINWQYILAAANTTYDGSNNIVSGYGNNMYGPNDTTTLAQFMTVIRHMVEYNNGTPEEACAGKIDVSGITQDWARSAIMWGANHCMFEGTSYREKERLTDEDANSPIKEIDAIKIVRRSMENCSPMNPVVTKYITNANDSYNSTNAGAIYTITLTPSDIKEIKNHMESGRAYGKDIDLKYDSGSTLDCSNIDSCTSIYLNILEEKGILVRG